MTKRDEERKIDNAPIFVPINDPRKDAVRVRARADQEQDHEQQGLEVEEGGLDVQYSVSCSEVTSPSM